ncbi:MAG: cobalamin-binding protein, partial [Burkholderiales bacterium]
MNSFFPPPRRDGVKSISAIAATCCAFAALAAASPIVVNDDRGKTLALEAPARRIVALAPNITELAYAAGAGGKLVGVSGYSDYPQEAKNIVRVGDAMHADIERIAMLKPDLVLAWKSGNHAGDIGKLEKFGIKVFVMEPAKLPDIPRLLRSIGKLADTSAAAETAAEDFERKLETLRKRYSTKRPISVFYEIWNEPLMTVNGTHMISDVLRLCGGTNAFATARMLTPVISAESLVAADPEVIISGSSKLENWQRYKMLGAVRNHQVFFVQPDLLERQSPRILEGASEVCKQLDNVRQGDN